MDHEDDQPEEKVLKGDYAISLWKQGREKWNAWVADHPDWGVDFSRVDFSTHVGTDEGVSFDHYRFPSRLVSFYRAQFGDGTVSFSGVQFGDGGVRFREAQFGDGDVSFYDAQFGEGYVDFSAVQFGQGNVSFDGAQFGDGSVNFLHAQFGEGRVNFQNTQFGEGNVVFIEAQFGEGNVTFREARFGEGRFSLYRADLVNVKRLTFKGARWKGSVEFDPRIGSKTEEIDFSSAAIDGELSFGAFTTPCVIDLRHTKLNHPIDLDRVVINYRPETHPRRLCFLRYPVALNQDASTCFRRLKKLAKEADDHERALDFYAKEMRSSYGRELKGWPLFLYLLYDKISDYGRSLLIPTTLLCAMIVMYGLVYFQISSWQNIGSFAGLGSMDRAVNVVNHFGSALTFSLAHALPFYFGSREANSDTMGTLFSTNPPDYLHWLTISQGMVCGVLLFLTALALRNRFRS